MHSAIISIENLTKSFSFGEYVRSLLERGASGKPQPTVLKGVNLEVREGEVLGLLGPNGAGKTTLIEILATLLLPTSGRALVCGHDVVKEAAQVRRMVSFCSTVAENFYPRLSATQNLEFFALLNNLPLPEARQRIQTRLAQVGLREIGDAPFQHYSEGVKQRLGLARALLTNPMVLLLDEPTRSLDPLLQAEVRKLLRALLVDKLGKTVLLVTHSLVEAEQVCDRLAIMHHGRIVAVGTVEEIKHMLGGTDLASAFEHAVGGA